VGGAGEKRLRRGKGRREGRERGRVKIFFGGYGGGWAARHHSEASGGPL
jgi:hypothetical protein